MSGFTTTHGPNKPSRCQGIDVHGIDEAWPGLLDDDLLDLKIFLLVLLFRRTITDKFVTAPVFELLTFAPALPRAVPAAPATIVTSRRHRLNGDVGVMPLDLKKSDSGNHGSYHHHSRQGVRQHVLHDVFRRLRHLIARDEDPNLFL